MLIYVKGHSVQRFKLIKFGLNFVERFMNETHGDVCVCVV